jgi:hypothetical protein
MGFRISFVGSLFDAGTGLNRNEVRIDGLYVNVVSKVDVEAAGLHAELKCKT